MAPDVIVEISLYVGMRLHPLVRMEKASQMCGGGSKAPHFEIHLESSIRMNDTRHHNALKPEL